MEGENQYKDKGEFQSWSIFFEIKANLYRGKNGQIWSLTKSRGRLIYSLQLGWYREFFVPTDVISRGFFIIWEYKTIEYRTCNERNL